MHRIATSLLLMSGSALAHEGHGAVQLHLHGWEYTLLAAAIVAAAIYWARK